MRAAPSVVVGRWSVVVAAGAAMLVSVPALAQERDEDAMFGAPARDAGAPDAGSAAHDEDSMFGAPTTDAPPEQPAAAPSPVQNIGPPTDEPSRDRQALEPGISDRFASGEEVDEPLKIGGQFYFRGIGSYAADQKFKEVGWSAPTLVDVYFDGRPSDRVRAFVSGRLTFDPSVEAASQASAQNGLGGLLDPEGGVSQSGQSLLTGQAVENPRVLLDQAWLRFDIARAVFVTLGKQHVKWGASRFWNPTDYLSPSRRNPLQVFDVRTGASMVKLHVPWEAKGWNFYALGLLDNTQAANTLGKLGGALRSELVFGTAEIGADAVVVMGRKPRFGIDLSTPIGPVDAYAEVSLRGRPDAPLWRRVGTLDDGLQANDFERFLPEGPQPSASGGINYTFAYRENDTVTLGLEYFYNALGTDDAQLYPWLILNGEFTPFYLGKQYGAAYVLLPGPGNWDNTSFVFSTLGNLSDGSFVSRLDVSQRVLTYLTVEAFASGHYGNKGGEFRFGVDQAPFVLSGVPIPAIHIPAPVFELGAAVRVSL